MLAREVRAMHTCVKVDLEMRGYDIIIGRAFGLPRGFSGDGRAALVVADSHTGPLYAEAVCALLTECGFSPSFFEVEAGETSKSLDCFGKILERAVFCGLDRKSLIVALGGGVVGDLAGFAAASYLRGVSFLQIPTSLLAMVDSSVGGKTGINLTQGKNLVGAFYQPLAVSINLDTLDTLPEREYLSGLAEVVKYGVIYDADFFGLVEQEQQALRMRDKHVLEQVIGRCCEIKADVVAQDEKEGGVRAILNYGHTLGHAIETVLGYGALLHGEAVSIGMVYANELSREVCGLSAESCQQVTSLLQNLGLPVGLSDDPGWDLLRKVMSTDKKAQRGLPKFVLVPQVGEARFGCEVPEDLLRQAYERIRLNCQKGSGMLKI